MNDTIKRQLDAIEKSGMMSFPSSLRGNKLCCEDNKNIKFLPIEVPPDFDINNKTQKWNIDNALHPCYCKICGSKYFGKLGLPVGKLMTRTK